MSEEERRWESDVEALKTQITELKAENQRLKERVQEFEGENQRLRGTG